jgi:hypothetical protein
MSWDYSDMSKAAKAAGGPEAFVNMLEEESRKLGRSEGHSDMVPVVIAASAIAIGIERGIVALVNHFRKKRLESERAVEEAKEEIVNGIKEYDASHSNEDEATEPPNS